MKRILFLSIIMLILLFSPAACRGSGADKEKAEVKKVIEDLYIKGWFLTGDAEIIKKAFHKSCDYMAFMYLDVKKIPVSQMLEKFEVHPEPATGDFSYKFISLTTGPRSAGAVLEVTIKKEETYTIHLSLFKLKEGWKIVNKIIYQHGHIVPRERKVKKIDPGIYETYVGRYRDGEGVVYNVKKGDGRLLISTQYHGDLEFFPESETTFFSMAAEVVLTFDKDGEGDVTGFTINLPEKKITAKKLMPTVSVFSGTGKEFALKEVVAGPFMSKEEALRKYGGHLPDGLELLSTGSKSRLKKGYFVLKTDVVVYTKHLAAVTRISDEYGNPAVEFVLKPEGAERLKAYSSANIGKTVAVILDNQVLTAPKIAGVLSKRGWIVGRFTQKQVDDIILQLKLSMAKF